jgi:hypothetical protein
MEKATHFYFLILQAATESSADLLKFARARRQGCLRAL